MKLKGEPAHNAATLIVAGVAGATTGVAVEGASVLAKLGIAVIVGLIVGGLLYVVIGALRRRGSS
jgi:hypothetical protein